MTNYGFEIVQTLIVDTVPDATVKRAMNEINAGQVFLQLFIFFEWQKFLFSSKWIKK